MQPTKGTSKVTDATSDPTANASSSSQVDPERQPNQHPEFSQIFDESLPLLPPTPLASSSSTRPEVSGVPAAREHPSQQPEPNVPVIPFDTYRFYKELATSFEPPVARTFMRSTRSLLVDRIRRTAKNTLHVKDFDNSAYLFRAALSELRTELTMRTRKESAALRTTLTALRKEVDLLDAKMKEDIATLKHEIQMDLNNRKSESKSDTNAVEIAIEEFNHRTMVRIGDLRTVVEQAKWENTRRGVLIIGTLVLFVMISMELAPKPPPPAPPKPVPPEIITVERPLPDVRQMESTDEGVNAEEKA